MHKSAILAFLKYGSIKKKTMFSSFGVFSRIITVIFLLFLSETTFATVSNFNIDQVGFADFPLSVGKPSRVTVTLSGLTSDQQLKVKFEIYRDGIFWNNQLEKTVFANLFPDDNTKYTLSADWSPSSLATYFITASILDSNGNVLKKCGVGGFFSCKESSKKYQVVDYRVVSAVLERFAKKALDMDPSVTLEELIQNLREVYKENHKLLFYTSADISISSLLSLGLKDALLCPGCGENIGLAVYIDVMDYFGITSEGKHDWVSTWLDAKTFFGISLPAAIAGGIVPVSFEIGKEDNREFFSSFSSGGTFQLGAFKAKFFASDNDGFTLLDVSPGSDAGVDLGFGTRSTQELKLEIQREQLEAIFAKSIFEEPDYS